MKIERGKQKGLKHARIVSRRAHGEHREMNRKGTKDAKRDFVGWLDDKCGRKKNVGIYLSALYTYLVTLGKQLCSLTIHHKGVLLGKK